MPGVSKLAAATIGSGGATPYRNISLGVTGQVLKATTGRVYGWHIINSAASARYVKFYDKATAPTEADTPVLSIKLAASGVDESSSTVGIAFQNGIAARATTALADNDTGAPTANDVLVNVLYG
jgi:hypothetical protein